VLFLRHAAGDFVYIGTINADIVQLVVRIAGELLEYVSVSAASPQETRK
jgi:hypothetical protein